MKGHRQAFAAYILIREADFFALRFPVHGVMNRHAPNERREDHQT